MYCRKCGKELQNGAKFCQYCGAEVIQSTASTLQKITINEKSIPSVVSKSLKGVPARSKSMLNESRKQVKDKLTIMPETKKKARKALVAIIAVLSLYTVALIALSTLVYLDKISIPSLNDIFISMGIKEPAVRPPEAPKVDETPKEDVLVNDNADEMILTDQYKVTPPDAEEYFNNNSTVLSVLNVEDVDEVFSESEVYDLLAERGLGEYEIVTDYYMDGEFEDDMEISRYSSDKHPIYQTYYMTPEDDWWSIFIINNAIYASPVSYNLQDVTNAPVTISETEEIISYDSTTNKYYINHPNQSVMTVKTVERIDSETLDRLTKEEIDKL